MNASIIPLMFVLAGIGQHAADTPPRRIAAPPNELEHRLFKLRHADASEVAEVVSEMFTHAQIIAVERNNSILASASRKDGDRLRELINELDVPATSESRHDKERKQREMRIFQIANARASELANTLSEVVREVRLAVDARTNAIIASGPAEHFDVIEAVIADLDRMDAAGGNEKSSRAITMNNVSAIDAIEQLQGLLSQATAKSVSVTTKGRQSRVITVSGPRNEVDTVESLLRDIDHPTTRGDSYFVQITCLSEQNAEQGNHPLTFPGADAVAHELDTLGIVDPSQVFRTFTRVYGGTDFRMSGTTDGGAIANVQGKAQSHHDEKVNLELQAVINRPSSKQRRQTVFSVETTVEVPLGDQVVLGAAPHDGTTYVLVVRVDRAATSDEGRHPSNRSTRSGARPNPEAANAGRRGR